MLKLDSEYTEDETALVLFTVSAGQPVDPETVLATVNRLFATAEYDDHEEYVIDTAGVVPEKPGPERNKMWAWIGQIEKRLGIDVEVWGSSGEYLTPTTLNGCTYSSDNFGNENDRMYIERALADDLKNLAEFHRAWRAFATSTRARQRVRV